MSSCFRLIVEVSETNVKLQEIINTISGSNMTVGGLLFLLGGGRIKLV